jgi:tetratricopeptide (TPR) repeat protein
MLALCLFLAGVAAVLLPVAVRNYAVGGSFYLTTSQFGSNFYIGNNPRARGSYMSLREGRGSPEYERLDATELAEAAAGRPLTAAEVSGHWTAQALSYVRSQPGDWLGLVARKTRLLMSSTEIIDTESQESHAEHSWSLWLLGPVWHFGVLLPLGVIGAIALWPERRRLWPLYALTAAYAASVILFFVVARYRLPLVPFVMLFAAGGVVWLGEAFGRRTTAKRSSASPRVRAMSVMAAALVAAVSNWPLHTAASQQAITENNLGAALQESGRYDDAIERYRRALTFNPGYAPAMNNLGTALRAAGRVDEAVAVFDQALTIDPKNASVFLNRGNAQMAQGKLPEAIASFRQAVAINPQASHAVMTLASALFDAGTAAMEAGAFDRAATALREAVALRPDYADAHNNLGIALASQGQLQEAMSEWETALRLKPDFADARRNLELARRAKN